jgi:hypothetical protein
MGPNQSVIVAIMQPVAAEPYRAEKTTQSKWTLGDGTVISRETRGTIARDAEGRVREELYQTHSGSMDGHEVDMALQSATVGDPTTHTILFWSGGMGKIAMRMELPSLPAGALATLGSAPPVILRTPPPPGPPLSPAAAARMAEAIATMPAGTPTIVLKDLGTPNNNMPNMGMPTSTSAPTVRALKETSPPPGVGSGTLTVLQPPVFLGSGGAKDNVRTEELGQKTMAGLLVVGKRVTTTIATGKIGNDRPIVVLHEEWRSPEMKIVVKTIDSDPRTGEQTMELDNLVRGDPDAALFQAPVGYEVKDMADMLKGLGELGKTKTP